MSNRSLEIIKESLEGLSEFNLFILQFFGKWPEIKTIIIDRNLEYNDEGVSDWVYKLEGLEFRSEESKQQMIGRLLAKSGLGETVDKWQELLEDSNNSMVSEWEALLLEGDLPDIPFEFTGMPLGDTWSETREIIKKHCKAFLEE